MNATIEALQRFLVDLGIDCGGVDGVWGPKTAYGLARDLTGEIGVDAALLASVKRDVSQLVPLRAGIRQTYGDLQVINKASPKGACSLVNRDWLSNLVTVRIFGHDCRVHRKAAPFFIAATAECERFATVNYPKRVPTVVQTYCLRRMCWNPARPLSYHSWGIAVDMDPSRNRMGTRGDIPGWLVDIWESWGFKWGGNWQGKQADPMHFELVR